MWHQTDKFKHNANSLLPVIIVVKFIAVWVLVRKWKSSFIRPTARTR